MKDVENEFVPFTTKKEEKMVEREVDSIVKTFESTAKEFAEAERMFWDEEFKLNAEIFKKDQKDEGPTKSSMNQNEIQAYIFNAQFDNEFFVD